MPEVSSGSDRRMLSAALNAMVGSSPQSLRATASRSQQQQQGQGQPGEGHNHRPGSRAQSPSVGLPRNYSPVGGGGGGNTRGGSGGGGGGGSRRCGSASFQRDGSCDRALSSGSQHRGGSRGGRGAVVDTFDSELEVAQALFDLKAGS